MSLANTIYHNDEYPENYKYSLYYAVILYNLEGTPLNYYYVVPPLSLLFLLFL